MIAQGIGLLLFLTVIWRPVPVAPGGAARGLRRGAGPRARGRAAGAARCRRAPRHNLALLAYFRVLSGYGGGDRATTSGCACWPSLDSGTGFGTAASTLVGQALGARNPDAATRAGWRATGLSLGVAAALGAICLIAPARIAGLFTHDAALVAELVPFLVCLALAQPSLQTHFALGGALRGAGDTWTPFVAATVGNWALRVPLAFLFAYAGAARGGIWGVIVRTTWRARSGCGVVPARRVATREQRRRVATHAPHCARAARARPARGCGEPRASGGPPRSCWCRSHAARRRARQLRLRRPTSPALDAFAGEAVRFARRTPRPRRRCRATYALFTSLYPPRSPSRAPMDTTTPRRYPPAAADPH